MKIAFIFSLFLILSISSASSDLDELAPIKEELNQLLKDKTSNLKSPGLLCKGCLASFSKIQSLLLEKKRILLPFGVKICSQFLNATACKGIVDSFGIDFLNNFFFHISDGRIMCPKIFLCEAPHELNFDDYAKKILADKPVSPPPPKPDSGKNLKMLWISDIHMDFEYEEGYNAKCNEPNCCRPENGGPKTPADASLYWGTVASCDLPPRTVEAIFEEIGKSIEFDFILWTGDNISHDLWHQSQKNQTYPTKVETEFLKKYLKPKTLIPIFGNHECYPADDCGFNGESNWLWEQTSDIWKEFLDDGAYQSLRTKGFYTSFYKEFNFRMIVLDTQACDVLNFFLIPNPTDPKNMLDWLHKTLLAAEKANEDVYITAHIPPSDDFCAYEWNRRYNVLVERFEYIIKGQFFGHTHNDQLSISYTYKDKKPSTFSLITPSLTTFEGNNPAFRVVSLDSGSHKVVDYEQYRFDVVSANKDKTKFIAPTKAYSLLEEYGLKDISAESFAQLAERMKTDKNLVLKYRNNFSSKFPITPTGEPTADQIKHTICDITEPDFFSKLHCTGIWGSLSLIFVKLASGKDIAFLFFNFLEGKWFEFPEEENGFLKK